MTAEMAVSWGIVDGVIEAGEVERRWIISAW